MTVLENSKAYRFVPIVSMTRLVQVGRERSGSGPTGKGTTFSAMVTDFTSLAVPPIDCSSEYKQFAG